MGERRGEGEREEMRGGEEQITTLLPAWAPLQVLSGPMIGGRPAEASGEL